MSRCPPMLLHSIVHVSAAWLSLITWSVGPFLPALSAQAGSPEHAVTRQRAQSDFMAGVIHVEPLIDGLRPGVRAEVRIGLTSFTAPMLAVRIVDSAGTVTGTETRMWLSWGIDTAKAAAIEAGYVRPGRCEPLARRTGALTCRTRWATPPDWRRVLQQLTAAGVWALPAPSNDGGYDGWAVTVESRRGQQYQLAYYWLPNEQGPAVAQLATAVGAILDSLPRVQQ